MPDKGITIIHYKKETEKILMVNNDYYFKTMKRGTIIDTY